MKGNIMWVMFIFIIQLYILEFKESYFKTL